MPDSHDAPERQLATSLERALSDLLRELLTEPMTISRLAYWFKVGRHRMPSIIDETPGVKRTGGLIRFPLWRMPPEYLVKRGIIRPNLVELGGETTRGAE